MRRQGDKGFTLLEVLVAISVLAVITGIVYGSFVGVVNATEMAQREAERLRRARFMRRAFRELFTTVYSDPSCLREELYFAGIDDTGPYGPMDAVEFCSSAPMIGGRSLPGALKRVTIGGEGYGASNQTLDDLELPSQSRDENESWTLLHITEAPLVRTSGEGIFDDDQGSSRELRAAADVSADAMDLVSEAGYDTPSWTIPIHTFDVTYCNGENFEAGDEDAWEDEWDSLAEGRMPWAVRIRVNFGRTEEELEEIRAEGIDLEETPDFEMIIPLPVGVGALSEFLLDDSAQSGGTRGSTENEAGDGSDDDSGGEG